MSILDGLRAYYLQPSNQQWVSYNDGSGGGYYVDNDAQARLRELVLGQKAQNPAAVSPMMSSFLTSMPSYQAPVSAFTNYAPTNYGYPSSRSFGGQLFSFINNPSAYSQAPAEQATSAPSTGGMAMPQGGITGLLGGMK